MKMLHTSCCLEGTRHSARDRYPTFLTATVTVLDTWGDSWSSLPATGTTVSLVSIPVRLSPNGSVGKESICNAGDTGDADSIPGLGRSLEKEMATHSGILAWKISWTEEPAGLQSKESERVGYNRVTKHVHQWAVVFAVQHDHISQQGNSCPGQMSSEWETGTQVWSSSVLGRAAIEVMLAMDPICLEVACKWAHVHTLASDRLVTISGWGAS